MSIAAKSIGLPQRADDGGPLATCIAWLAAAAGTPISTWSLAAGLPLEKGRLTLANVDAAMERANLEHLRISEAPLSVAPALWPLLVAAADGSACVWIARRGDEIELFDGATGQLARRVVSDAPHGIAAVIVTKPRVTVDGRVDDLVPAPSKSWFRTALLRYRAIYANVLLAAVLVNLFGVLTPLFSMNVYDRVVPNFATDTLLVLTVGMGIVLLFDLLLRHLRGHFVDIAGRRVDVRLSSQLFEHLLDVRLEDLPRSAGSLANQLGEFEQVREFMASATLTVLVDIPFAVFFLAVIALIGGPIAWVPALTFPLLLLCAYAVERPLAAAVVESQQHASQKTALVYESTAGLQTLKALNGQGAMQGRFDRHVAAAADAAARSRSWSMLAMHLSSFLQQVAYVGIIVWGVFRIHDGLLTTGGLIACSLLNGRALGPLAQSANLLTRWGRTRLALESLQRIMALRREHPSGTSRLQRGALFGGFTLRDVTFAYPNQMRAVLAGVNLVISPGEKVGIIGRNGSGKSTLARLLVGLYETRQGEVRVDDADIRALDVAEVRRSVAYMTQEPLLFFGSVRHNLTLGNPLASDAQILDACRRTGVDEFVRRHPDGYEAVIGERGEGFSVGQRQSLALARALIANASALVLDEPTAALDSTSEEQFIQLLRTGLAGRTVVLVTHKASVLAAVDRLILLDHGRVIADGPKEQVLAQLRPATAATPRREVAA